MSDKESQIAELAHNEKQLKDHQVLSDAQFSAERVKNVLLEEKLALADKELNKKSLRIDSAEVEKQRLTTEVSAVHCQVFQLESKLRDVQEKLTSLQNHSEQDNVSLKKQLSKLSRDRASLWSEMGLVVTTLGSQKNRIQELEEKTKVLNREKKELKLKLVYERQQKETAQLKMFALDYELRECIQRKEMLLIDYQSTIACERRKRESAQLEVCVLQSKLKSVSLSPPSPC